MTKHLWKIILAFIFIRPFISELAYGSLDIIMIGIFIFADCLYIFSKKPRFFTALDKTVFAFLASITISLGFCQNLSNGILSTYRYLALGLLFYSIKATDEKEVKELIFVLIISAIFIAFYSLRSVFIISKTTLAYLSKNNVDYPFAQEFISRNRAFFPFISPNLLANYLVMIIMLNLGITLYKLKENKKHYSTWANLLCIVLGTVTLVFTKSIGGWVTLAASLSLFLTTTKQINKKTIFVTFSIIIIIIALVASRFEENKKFTSVDFSISARLSYWKNTLSLIAKHPLTGTRIGNFSLEETLMSHNSYLQIWAEMGILALLSWLGIVFLFLKKSYHIITQSKNGFIEIGLVCAGMAFLIQNFFDFSFFITQASFLWWIILGLIDEVS